MPKLPKKDPEESKPRSKFKFNIKKPKFNFKLNIKKPKFNFKFNVKKPKFKYPSILVNI